MKNSSIILLLVLLGFTSQVVKPQPFDDQAANYTLTETNDDPNSCVVNLTLENHQNYITFFVTIVSNPVPDCTHHDLQLWSVFRGDNLDAKVTLSPTGDPNVVAGNLTLADIQKYNGTACLSTGVVGGAASQDRQNFCQLRYNNIYLQVTFGIDSVSGLIDPDWSGQWNIQFGPAYQDQKLNYTIWKSNISYPQIVGMLYSECGGWSNRISNLSNKFLVTGTNMASENLNLYNYLSGYGLYAMWIRPNSANASTSMPYTSLTFDASKFPFGNDSNSSCSDTGFLYSDFISNLDQCANGCALSLLGVSNDGHGYILQTNGVTTGQ